MLVELWRIADIQGAAHRGGWVTLGGTELQSVTGRVHKRYAVRSILNLAEFMSYSTRIEGESILVCIDNFAKIQGLTPQHSANTTHSPSPSPSLKNKEEDKSPSGSRLLVVPTNDPPLPDDAVTPEEIVEGWQAVCVPRGAAAVREVTPERRRKLRLRIREHPKFEWWEEVFQRAAASPFLFGNGKTGWRATFDWFIANGGNTLKILEGNYDAKRAR